MHSHKRRCSDEEGLCSRWVIERNRRHIGCALAWHQFAGLERQQDGVSVGAKDIGGIVTGAQGPEAGVWVIAETTDLPTKYVQDRRHRRSRAVLSFPICRRPTTPSGCAATGWSIRPKVQAQPGKIARAESRAGARTPKQRRNIIPRSIGIRCWEIPRQKRISRHRPQAGRQWHGAKMQSQQQWLDIVKTDGCFTCHQLGDRGDAQYRKVAGPVRSPRPTPGSSASRSARPAAT